MGLADLHVHSIYSYDGTSTISAILKYAVDHTGLDVIAITDHDTVRGVHEALDLAPYYGIDVIPGCEISTADGHLLALFIDRPIQAGLSLSETVLRVGDLGGLCIAAHPMARGVNSLRFETIREALKDERVARSLVGVEAFNAGLIYTRGNPEVVIRSRQLPLAQCGNSDAHLLEMIGHGMTQFAGSTAQEMRLALANQETSVWAGQGLGGMAVITSYVPRIILRKLGWAAWSAGPQSRLTYTRFSRLMASQQS
jgi:predicted metal-dependent phosphoesterase TrpH